MISNKNNHNLRTQSGVALLVLVIIIALSSISYVFSSLSTDAVEHDLKIKTQKALKRAKRALITFAVTYADRADKKFKFGYLPCPDASAAGLENVEGGADGNCGTAFVNTVGYLPWRSLELPLLTDGDGNCLLYAVSSTYKANPQSQAKMLNEDTYGMFQVVDSSGAVTEGVEPGDRPVAIIFAPGKAIAGQSRTFKTGSNCGEDYGNFDEYLEGNATTNNGVLSSSDSDIDQFIQATADSDSEAYPYNDRFITITRDEIWSRITARQDFKDAMDNLTQGLALCLAAYANMGEQTPTVDRRNTSRRLPWPVPLSAFSDDREDYNIDDHYDDHRNEDKGYSGRYPFIVDGSNDDINEDDSDEDTYNNNALDQDELFEFDNLCDDLLIAQTEVSSYRVEVNGDYNVGDEVITVDTTASFGVIHNISVGDQVNFYDDDSYMVTASNLLDGVTTGTITISPQLQKPMADRTSVTLGNVVVSLKADVASPPADKYTNETGFRTLWANWKDHFFYILSEKYEPKNSGFKKCKNDGTNCINVVGSPTEFAAAVIYSGTRLEGITRNDKSIISDYLENDKATLFAEEASNENGAKSYTNSPTAESEAVITANDTMYCINHSANVDADATPSSNNNLTVILCPVSP